TSLLGHTDTAVSGRTPVRICPPRQPPTDPEVTSSVSAEVTPRPTPNRPAPARRGDLPRPRPPRLTRPVLVRRDQPAYAEVTHVFRRSGRSLLNVAGAVDFRASPLVGGCSCPPPQRIRPRILRRAPRCHSPAVPTSSSDPSLTPPPHCWPPTTTTSSSSV